MSHAVKLYLAPEIRRAIIQYMAKHELDKEYATLVLLIKQLFSEGFICREVYDVYLNRYSRKLVGAPFEHASLEEMRRQKSEKSLFEEKQRQFSMVIDQWQIHGVEWRKKWIATAKEWKGKVSNAHLILELET